MYGIGRAHELLFGAHVLLPIKSEAREGYLRNISPSAWSAGENEIVGSRVIENHQEASDHIARIAPVSSRIQIPQAKIASLRSLISAAARQIFRVTKFSPRRGDS